MAFMILAVGGENGSAPEKERERLCGRFGAERATASLSATREAL